MLGLKKKKKKTHVFDNQGGCVCRCRNCSEELRMLCLWPRSVFIFICFQCLFVILLIDSNLLVMIVCGGIFFLFWFPMSLNYKLV